MTKKFTPIFATQTDLSEVLREVSKLRQLSFVDSGLHDHAPPPVFSNVENIEPFRTYLAFDQGASVETRVVPQRGGGEKYAVQSGKVHGFAFFYGELFEGRRLISGQISPIGESNTSSEIYALIAKVVRRSFEKIQSTYVGPEAVKLLDSGMRLTSTTKSPEIYDLTR